MRLTLVVNNTDDLNGGTKASYVFDEQGGVIGARDSADWMLSDRSGSVEDRHLHISYVDDAFCAEVLAVQGVSVNGSKTVLSPGETFRLSDGDILKIGIFDVSAYVSLGSKEEDAARNGENWARRFVSVGTLVGDNPEEAIEGSNLFDAQIMKRQGNVALHERIAAAQNTDPVSALEVQRESRSTDAKDPVDLFDRDQKPGHGRMSTGVDDYLNLIPEKAHETQIPDDLHPGSAYFALPATRVIGKNGNTDMTEPASADLDAYLETLVNKATDPRKVHPRDMDNAFIRDSWGDAEHGDAIDGEEQLVDHVILRPLCAALGLPIQSMTGPQANRLARDVGEAMKAAVAGIMENHKRELSDKSHLAETHLHAIEDNPLRLEQTPEDAIRDLFMVQSPVHLSAASAIQESLTLLCHHQEASEAASDAALDAVLRALSPVALARRFKKYKGHAPRAGDLDAWHWAMYQHYYAEIRTDQQGGLSRMFWEVYRQVYDREMRLRTSEG